MRAVLYLAFLLFINSFSVFSQGDNVGIDPDTPLNSLTMDQWTGRDGLISNNLTSVNQSSNKFIWITSFNGILRFDGINFKLFDKSNLPFLNSNGFYQSFEDSKGNFWFTSQSSGILKMTNNKFHQILTDEQNSISVRCIEEDLNNNIWVGTNNEGVYMLQDSVLVKVDFGEFNNTPIMDIVVDSEGKIWFATNGYGLFIYDGEKIETYNMDDGLNHNTVNKLVLDKDGSLFAGTMDGVYHFDKKGNERLKLFDGLEVNDFFIDDFRNIWTGTEQGLYKLNLASRSFDSFTEANGLPASQISSLTFDHENSLWLSSKKAGLLRFRDGFFKNYTTKEGLTSNNVNIIIEHDDSYFVGCDDGLINVIKGGEIRRFELSSFFLNIGIRDINFGDDGELLIASYKGLLRIKDGKEEMIDLQGLGASNDVRRILRDKEGTIWLATRSSGVVKIEDKTNVSIYNSSNELKSNYILALEENKNGDIYVGTHSGGLSVIKHDGEVINYPIEDGNSGILIFNMQILDNNSIMLATNIGMYKFENGVFRRIVLDENLNSETIFDIVLENENAWLSTNLGLIQVKMPDINSFLEGDMHYVPGRLFDRYDGMESQECTGATRMTLAKDNCLLIPTLGGVAKLNPRIIQENINIPEVFITEFNTDAKSRDLVSDKKLQIEPDVLRYEIYFTSLSFIAPPKVRFRYKLDGVDDDWIDVGTEREAVYTNLPHGNYTFTVVGSNNDGVWNENGASIKFRVNPYFYETTLFYILVIVSLGLIVWGIFVWRLRSIERVNSELLKLNEELDRFVYSASHDLRAPLSSVLGLVEIARMESTIEAKNECLGMIDSSIKKLDGFINDIIDYSRNQRMEIQPDAVDIQKEADDAIADLKYLDKDNQIEKTVLNYESRHFITDGRRLNVVLKNLISNAIRYHDLSKDNPFIKVEIKYHGQSAIISVSDNGIGIDTEHLENIFKMFYRADEGSKGSGLGLYIVKETVDKLNGEISVVSEQKKGSTFTITLPPLKPLA